MERNMVSLFLTKGEKVLLLYREGSKVANHLWIASAGGHMEKDELNNAHQAEQDLHRHLGAVGVCCFLYAQQTRGDHLRLVDDQRVALAQVIQYVAVALCVGRPLCWRAALPLPSLLPVQVVASVSMCARSRQLMRLSMR